MNCVLVRKQKNLPWQVIVTKGDLLSVESLSQSCALIEEDIRALLRPKTEVIAEKECELPQPLLVVSAKTGAGVRELWSAVLQLRDEVTLPTTHSHAVREHIRGNEKM